MKGRLLGLGVGLGALLLAALWGFGRLGGPESVPAGGPRARPAARDRAQAQPSPGAGSDFHARRDPGAAAATPAVGHNRDLFRYGDGRAGSELGLPARRSHAARPVTPEVDASPAASAPAGGPKLVGFVRQGARLKAVLALEGQVLVAAPGERAVGYLLESVDVDLGVRLRAPDGTPLTLAPPR